MANILHLDESEVACMAMRGIVTRANHRVVTVHDTQQAWTQLRELVKIDLIFLELKLKGENGIAFLGRLRADPFFRHVPAVVYSSVGDQAVVRRALALSVQNYLIKPFNDDHIYNEIAKAVANSWRGEMFEEERSFTAQMGLSTATLKAMREKLLGEIDTISALLKNALLADIQKKIPGQLDLVAADAEASGVWVLFDCIDRIRPLVSAEQWKDLEAFVPDLDFVKRLIFCQIHPDHLPEGFLDEREKRERDEARERSRWLDVDVSISGQIVDRQAIEVQVDSLAGCPVVDSVAASFAMFADGQVSNLARVQDVVAKDPGLSTQVLIAVNKIERENMNQVEDPRVAISLLGELRLNSLAKTLLTVEERHMHAPPITWPHYWMFMMGVARLSEFTCRYMEFKDMDAVAYTAGLIHDIGKLLLLRLHPFGFQAMVNHAKQHGIPLHTAEQRYIGTNTREMGARFAVKHGLPRVYCNVIQWVESPERAEADQEIVAAVSLARHLCLHNHVGYCGDVPRDRSPDIELTEAWHVLRQHVFPSFNLRQFEAQAHAFSKEIRLELLGRIL